jgi:hypothetical protein
MFNVYVSGPTETMLEGIVTHPASKTANNPKLFLIPGASVLERESHYTPLAALA